MYYLEKYHLNILMEFGYVWNESILDSEVLHIRKDLIEFGIKLIDHLLGGTMPAC